MHGTSWPVRMSIPASRSIPSPEMSRRALAASSSASSSTRSILPSTAFAAIVVTSNRAGRGSRAGLVSGIMTCFLSRRWLVSGCAGGAARARERGDGVGGDVVERLRGVGDHGDAVALDRQRRDPDAEVDRRDAELGEPRIRSTPARVSDQPPSERT